MYSHQPLVLSINFSEFLSVEHYRQELELLIIAQLRTFEHFVRIHVMASLHKTLNLRMHVQVLALFLPQLLPLLLPLLPASLPLSSPLPLSSQAFSLVESHHQPNDGHVAIHLERHTSNNEHLLPSVRVVGRVVKSLGFPQFLFCHTWRNLSLPVEVDVG